MVRAREGRDTAREARHVVIAGLAAAALALTAPQAAAAQEPPVGHIDGTPLDVYADGLGGLQMRFDGMEDGEFYGPWSNPGHAGLELRDDSSVSPVSDGQTRTRVSGPTLSDDGDGTHELHSVYDVALASPLEVTEDVTYADGSNDVALRYEIRNIGSTPATFDAGELADLFAAGSDSGRGVLRAGPPRFVGGLSGVGAATGLTEVTPWTHYQESFYNDVFDNFETGSGLDDDIEPTSVDNGVGVEWEVDALAPNATTTIEVTWHFDTPPSALTVNTTVDHDDSACDAKDCTLREALTYAAPGSTIRLPAAAGRYAVGSPLVSDRDLEIVGGGARSTTIDGGGNTGVLQVTGGTLDLSGVRITGGDNSGDSGGGIAVLGGTLRLSDSAVTGNTAAVGGGIYDAGSLILSNSTIAGNTAAGGPETSGDGGGIAVASIEAPASASLTNSTISDNRASGSGGGIAAGGSLTLLNATIAGNSAGSGGGIALTADNPLTLHNTLISGNTPGACGGTAGTITSGHDLVFGGSCGLSGPGDRETGNPLLAALANNGGPTDTRALGAGSPAIDAADGSLAPSTDQRGVARPRGAGDDIGAFEFVPPPPPPPPPPHIATPTPTPTPAPAPRKRKSEKPLPPPKVGKTVNARHSKGKVRVRLPGSHRYVVLKKGEQVPIGTQFDTTKGRVTLTSAADRKGHTQHARFSQGIFTIGQTKGRRPITTLRLTGPKPQCGKATGKKKSQPKRKAAGSTATTSRRKHKRRHKHRSRRHRERHLWGNGKGRFRTRGHYSSATVRGTKWLTRDTCQGTLVAVKHGVVKVRDFTRHKTYTVKGGHHHLAKPPKHKRAKKHGAR